MVAVYRAKLYVLCSMAVLPFLCINLSCQPLIIYVVVYFIGWFLEVLVKVDWLLFR